MSFVIKKPTWIERAFGLTDMVVDVPDWDGQSHDGYLIDSPIPNGRLMQFPLTRNGKVVKQALELATDQVVERVSELKDGDALTPIYQDAVDELVDIYDVCGVQAPPKLLAVHANISRATSLGQLYYGVMEQMDIRTMNTGRFHEFVDIVEDSGRLVVIYAIEGTYYTAELTVMDGEGVLGEATALEMGGNTTRTFHTTDADGRIRFVSISATSSLNRDSEIDSSTLFANIERRWREGGKPELTLDFYHFGEKARLGKVDYVKAEKNTLVISWMLDDNPIGRTAEQAILDDPDYWGHSIEYYPLENQVEWLGGKPVLVYHDGFLVRVAICAENKGASLFTKVVTRSVSMSIKQDLERLLGNKPELIESFMSQLDATNLRIEATVHRTAEETPVEAVTPVADGTAQTGEGETVERAVNVETESTYNSESYTTKEIELDDDTLKAIADAVLESENFKAMVDASIQMKLDEMGQSMRETLELVAANAVSNAIAAQVTRVDTLEAAVRRIADLPASNKQRDVLRVSTRPSQVGAKDVPDAEDDDDKSLASIAEKSLTSIPRPSGY